MQAEPNEVKDAVEYAIDVGYRHFDTAYLYENEGEVGKAVQKKIDEGIIRREDVFLTTKVQYVHPVIVPVVLKVYSSRIS